MLSRPAVDARATTSSDCRRAPPAAAEETCGPVAGVRPVTPTRVPRGSGRDCGEFAQHADASSSCGRGSCDDGARRRRPPATARSRTGGCCAETTCSEDAGDGYPVSLAATCTRRCNPSRSAHRRAVGKSAFSVHSLCVFYRQNVAAAVGVAQPVPPVGSGGRRRRPSRRRRRRASAPAAAELRQGAHAARCACNKWHATKLPAFAPSAYVDSRAPRRGRRARRSCGCEAGAVVAPAATTRARASCTPTSPPRRAGRRRGLFRSRTDGAEAAVAGAAAAGADIADRVAAAAAGASIVATSTSRRLHRRRSPADAHFPPCLNKVFVGVPQGYECHTIPVEQ